MMGLCLAHRQPISMLRRSPTCEGHSYIIHCIFFPLPQESSRGIHAGVNEIVLSIHKAIPPFPWGKKMNRTKSGYFIPPRKDEAFAYPTYKLRKNRMGWQLFCSVLCRFSCHPLTVPFWAPSSSNAAAICDVWCALPPPLPRAEPHIYFYVQWMLSSGRATCGCEQCLLTEQLLHNHTHSVCPLTPHSPPHRHHVPQHMEGCGVWTAHSMKPRHTENRKTKALLWTVTRCTVQQEFHMELPQDPPNKSTCLALNALPPPGTHSKTTCIWW